jgi:hypothetical protein
MPGIPHLHWHGPLTQRGPWLSLELRRGRLRVTRPHLSQHTHNTLRPVTLTAPDSALGEWYCPSPLLMHSLCTLCGTG